MRAILTAAVVAALVTLLVEYLAKPRLEARKDRIIEGHRATRRALAALAQARFQLKLYLHDLSVHPGMRDGGRLEDEEAAIREQAEILSESIGSGVLLFGDVAQQALKGFVFLIEYWGNGYGEDVEEHLALAVELCDLTLVAAKTHRWQRNKLRAVAERVENEGLGPDSGYWVSA